MGARARFGKYQIVRKIADGGMATIYLASSAGPDGFSKRCALKLIRPEFSERSEVVRMLVQEAKVAAVLSHPNIVQVFDFGKMDNEYFLTMEWIDGASLGHVLGAAIKQGKPISVGVITHIALAIAQALAYLRNGVTLDHEHVNLVHRDVTPSNVLISGAGVVKLTDFGIVKVLEAPTSTNIGVVKGKYAYMSPEQLRGDSIDHRSDVFAFGVVLYEMIARRRLFRRKTLAATIAAVHAARVTPPSQLVPGVPKELDQIVVRALAKKPSERYQTAQEIVDDLWPIYSKSSRGATTELIELVRSAVSAMTAYADAATAPGFGRTTHERSRDLDSDSAPDVEAGSDEEFEALGNVIEPSNPSLPAAPASEAHPTWSENESLPEAAFDGTESRIRNNERAPAGLEAEKRERLITTAVIAGALLATVIFWLLVLN